MQGQFIGKVSKDTGFSIDTIRFYEKVGLIKHPARTKGGYRTFRIRDIQDLRVIRRLVDLGVSLSELQFVLGLRHRQTDACVTVSDLSRRKLVTVRDKICLLRRLERELRRARQRQRLT